MWLLLCLNAAIRKRTGCAMRVRGQCGLGEVSTSRAEVSSLIKEGELPDPYPEHLWVGGWDGFPWPLGLVELPPGSAFPHTKPTLYFYLPIIPFLGTK